MATVFDSNGDDFRAMFEATSVGMVQADPVTRRLLRVNAALCAITGYDEAELLAMTVDDLNHPEDRERDRECFARLVDGNASEYQIEKRYLRKDGSVAWVQATANLIRGADGRPLRTVAMILDVTARKAVEERLATTTAQLEAILANLPIGLAFFDRELRFVRVNAEMARLNGKSPTAHVGSVIEDVLPSASRTLRPRLERVFATGEEQSGVEVSGPSPLHGGELGYALASWYPVTVDGETVLVGAAVLDITERKRAEEALRESEARFRTSVETLLDPFAIYEAVRDEAGEIVDFRTVYVNAAACAANRMTREEQVGALLCELLPAHRVTGLLDEYRRLVETGEPVSKEWLEYEDDYNGQRLHRAFDIQATKLGDGFAVSWRDVTVRKAIEETLRERERFVSGVVNASPGLIYVYDLATKRNIYVNDQFARLFGWTREDLQALGEGFLFHLIHPDDTPLVTAEAARTPALADGEVIELEYRLRRKDGAYRWLRSRDTVFGRDAEGKVAQVLGMAEDVTERKEAEEALRRSEAIYRRLAEANLFGVGFGTSTGGVTYVNDEMLRMMGRTREEFEAGGIDWAEALAPEYREAIAVEAQRVLREGSASGYEAAFLRPDGGRTPYLAAAALVEPGEDHHVSIALDLTQIRATEAALRESEARFRTMADETPVIIWANDAAGGIEFVNRAYCEFFGVPEEEVRGLNWQPLLHSDDAEAYLGAFFTALRAGMPFHAEARVRRADGAWRWIESFGAPRRRADGEILGMVGSSPDITERREAEARFRGLFTGVADAILVADAEGRYLDANPAASALLGYEREALLGLTVADVVARAPAWTAAEYARYRDEGFWRGELELRRKDGAIVPVEALATVVDLPTGRMYLSAVRDVSERKRDEAERVAFLDALAHDVKNPLGVVKGQAQLARRRLQRGMNDPVKLEASLDAIEEAGAGATSLIDELLDAARLRARQPLELRTRPVDLVALAERQAEDARQGSPEQVVQVESTIPTLVGLLDEIRLGRVLANLLGNAVKYSPDGGKVVVRVGREEDAAGTWAVVEVSDDGIGIPAADLPHVFERFRRGGNVAGIGGTGIGLAGSHQIVAQHGGTIAVKSVEGQGSTFTVRLPLG